MNYFKESISAIAIALVLGFVLTGCGFTQYKNPNGSTATSTTGTSVGSTSGGGSTTGTGGSGTSTGTLTATYSSINSQIIAPLCVGCHSNFSTYSGLMSVVTAGNPSGSKLYTMVQSGSMPQGGQALSTNEVDAIGTWITNGALNN